MPSPEWKLCNMRNYALVLFMSEDNHIRIKVICSVIQIQVCKAESIISLHFNIQYILSSIIGRLSWFNVQLLERTSTLLSVLPSYISENTPAAVTLIMNEL